MAQLFFTPRMKRLKHLWERLCSFENLAAAAREALLGKRGQHAGARFFADCAAREKGQSENLAAG